MSAAASAGFSAAAAASANRAAKERCRAEMQAYDPRAASVQEMQSYADCVDRIYPDPLSGSEVMAIKVLIVLALAGAAIGVFRANLGRGDLEEATLRGIVGAILAPLAAVIVAATGYGIWFLFQ